MPSAHIAELKFGLGREIRSRTDAAEEQLFSRMISEDTRRREAVRQRKEAELILRKAEAEKTERERRWARRQEEKARFTSQQRAWWDDELANIKADVRTTSQPDRTHMVHESMVASRSELALTGKKDLAAREKEVREAHERDVASWDAEWRTNRCADAMTMREDIRQRDEATAREFCAFQREAKARLAHETLLAAENQRQEEDAKFRTGERMRRAHEEHRQAIETMNKKSLQADAEYKSEMFLRDEAARKSFAAAKAAKAQDRLEYGRARQRLLESERRALESQEKRRRDVEKRNFHEQQRLKAAEAAVLAERTRREAEEKRAAAAMQAATRAKDEAAATSTRSKMALKELAKIKSSPATGGGGGSGSKRGQSARTAREAKMRSIYGNGSGALYAVESPTIEPSKLDFF